MIIELPARQRLPRRRKPPVAAPRPTALAEVLGELLRRDLRSPHAIAQATGIDPSYISRLLRGQRPAPSRELIQSIAQTLVAGQRDTWRLLVAAGYLPDEWDDPVLLDVADLLHHPALPGSAVDDFRRVVHMLCESFVRLAEGPEHGPAP